MVETSIADHESTFARFHLGGWIKAVVARRLAVVMSLIFLEAAFADTFAELFAIATTIETMLESALLTKIELHAWDIESLQIALGTIAEALINITGVLYADRLPADIANELFRLLSRVVIFYGCDACALGTHLLIFFITEVPLLAIFENSRSRYMRCINTDVHHAFPAQILIIPE